MYLVSLQHDLKSWNQVHDFIFSSLDLGHILSLGNKARNPTCICALVHTQLEKEVFETCGLVNAMRITINNCDMLHKKI